MPHPPCRWIFRYAVFTAVATLGLIALGGLVTSHGAGMAVPDWPTTYGYNMFLFPISLWKGGIFYEHTHRLYASLVGLFTVILAIVLQVGRAGRILVRMGWAAVVLVIVQGVLGGLRVNLMENQIGIVHAALAQLFLGLLVLIALFTSRAWHRWREQHAVPGGGHAAYRWVLAATVLIFVQLLLGATMRHQHAGLAIPDFPLAYGRIWPAADDALLQRANALRVDSRDFNPITAFQVHLHMTHRLFGLLITAAVIAAWRAMRRAHGAKAAPSRLGTLWLVLIVIQVALGAATVLSNKAADVATAHVAVGAACLGIGILGTAFCRAAVRPVPVGQGGAVQACSGMVSAKA